MTDGRSRAAVLFDVDGTLVDSNYLHVVAWWEAFRSRGHDVAMVDLHHHIGQGSAQLVEGVLGAPDDAVVDAHSDYYAPRLRQLRVLPGAVELLRRSAAAGLAVVLATSASAKEARHLRDALGADDVIEQMTTGDDADAAKPEPDVLQVSLDAVGVPAEHCVFVGDSVWDVEACQRVGVPCIALLSGGVPHGVLRDAGASAVYRDAADLLAGFEDSLLGRLARDHESGDRPAPARDS